MSRTRKRRRPEAGLTTNRFDMRVRRATRRLPRLFIKKNPEAGTAECRALHKKARGIRAWKY